MSISRAIRCASCLGHIRISLSFLTGLVLCLWTSGLQAQVLNVTSQTMREPLNAYLQYLEDPDSQLTMYAVRQEVDRPWIQNEKKAFNQGYSTSSWWLKIQLRMNLPNTERYVLEIAYAVLDYVDVAMVHQDGHVDQLSLGDKLPYRMRPVDHRYFIVPLTWETGELLTIYMHIRSTSSIQAPLSIWEESEFLSYNNTLTMIHGLYFGTMLAITLYNLLLYLALGERVYLYYVCFVSCMALFLASLSGQAFCHLWPTLTQWNDRAIIVFLAGSLVAGAQFSRIFLSLARYSRHLDRMVMACVGACSVMIIGAFVFPYHVNIQLLVPLAVVTCSMCLVIGGFTWLKGEHTAKYYCIAWTAMLLSGIVLALSKFNLIPTSVLTENATQLGSAIEVMLLSFALAERINVERRLRYEAQSTALETQLKVNQTLEQRVQERTHELESLNRKLQELSDTDPLTGLHNRRYLDALLDREWARAMRYGQPLAVMVIDVDHFKRVNDEHGHLVGDCCLQELAKRIQGALLRLSDQAMRYGGEEFCAVLAQTDLQGAFLVAERIRKHIEETPVVADHIALEITVSVGLAATLPAQAFGGVKRLLQMADEALYQSKANGRNRVTAAPIEISSADGPEDNQNALLTNEESGARSKKETVPLRLLKRPA